MLEAARVGDQTGHPGTITGPGVSTVLIRGLPAAVQGDTHTCAVASPPGPHPPTTIVQGSKTVRIGDKPAARVGDMAGCGSPIVTGASNVLIGG